MLTILEDISVYASVHNRCTIKVVGSVKLEKLLYIIERNCPLSAALCPQGCPPDQVKVVLSRLPPVSQKFAKYWICQARLMEKEGNLDVLSMFEKAVGVVLEVRHL